MAHQATMILDFQFGSTGKGLIAGYLAKRGQYDTVVCAFATNAGHTYIDKSRDMHVMTQQIPTSIIAGDSVKTALIGPGALIHKSTFLQEYHANSARLAGKNIFIHPQAAVVEDEHAAREIEWGMTKIGSTAKGVGAAMIERIQRSTENPNTAGHRWKDDPEMSRFMIPARGYAEILDESENLMIEGAQGYGLSMYHGFYPYTTSRDVTPWQLAADCGLPFKIAPYIKVVGTMRTYPIRVNNRDGSSGPGHDDQIEMPWSVFNVPPEVTTVTKLKRRIFTFSREQAIEAAWHCGGYWETQIFLNFANYCGAQYELDSIIEDITDPDRFMLNPPKVSWLGYGPDDSDIRQR